MWFITKLVILSILIVCVVGETDLSIKSANNSTRIFNWLLGIIGVSTTTPKPIVKECLPCQCGVLQNKVRIVNGTETKINQYPWMVYLTYKGLFLCGATLISDRYIISAAHGVTISRLGNLRAIFLDHDTSVANETNSLTRQITRIVINKEFNNGIKYNNDIAVLRLDKDIPSNDPNIIPICLPLNDEDTFENNIGTVIGWGSLIEYGDYSNTLQSLDIPIWSNSFCSMNTLYADNITDNMLCAGFKEGQKDACKGDSGGPLQININKRSTLVGIVSWGNGCGEENSPGVYTRVSKYLEWIANHTSDGCFCNSNINLLIK